MPDFEIHIKSAADLAALDATIAKLHGQIDATKMLGKSTADLEVELQKAQSSRVAAGLAEITGQTTAVGDASKKAAKDVEDLELSHHQLHYALERVAPGLANMARFLTSGFAGAVGIALVAFDYLNAKLDKLKQYLDDLNTGPGAKGQWAEHIRDNAREAAVEMAVLNDRLHAAAVAQETLDKVTDRVIAHQKDQAAATKEVGDAQKALELARLELAEKLGQLTPDQVVRIRLQIDDAAFKRQIAAEKAAIQAELSVRQQELSANEYREPTLKSARDKAGDASLAAKDAQDKNQSKLDQEKQDLATLKDAQTKMDQGVQLNDFIPQWVQKFAQRGSMVDMAKSAPEQLSDMIAKTQSSINQQEGKQQPLQEAAALSKAQFERAKADYEAKAKISEDTTRTISDLQAKLAAATAKDNALQNIHDQTSAVTRASQNADIANRVGAGHGTPDEIDQTASWQRQADAAHERGPQAGVDASDAISKGRNILATLQGQGGRAQPQQMQEVHEILDQIIGFLSSHDGFVQGMGSNLQDLANRLATLESRMNNNRGVGSR